jgi:hypothetical protein
VAAGDYAGSLVSVLDCLPSFTFVWGLLAYTLLPLAVTALLTLVTATARTSPRLGVTTNPLQCLCNKVAIR